MATRRQEKINSFLKKTIADFLVSEKFFAEAMISVLRAEVSADIKKAKIFVSVLPEEKQEEALGVLEKRKKEIRGHLAKKMKTKFLPSLFFEIDKSEKARQRIEEILRET